MKRTAKLSLAAACTVCVIASGLAGAQDSPVAAGVELPREVVAAAASFSTYMDNAAAISNRFASAEAVGQGLKSGVSYEPSQFQEGMIGYGALAALQEDRFISGLEAAANQAGGRRALADRLAADPAFVLQVDGARAAVRRVQAALQVRGDLVFSNGRHVKQAAYEIQHQAWSTRPVPDAHGRLAEVKSLSSSPIAASDADGARLIKAVLTLPANGGDGPAPTMLVVQALALAAEAELGAAGNDNLARLRPLMAEHATTDCLRMSKLNLFQCMAVAGPHYEDVFCLGQHALMDTGQCVSNAAGGTPAMARAAPPPPIPAGDRPFIVPVAQRSVAAGDH